MYVLGSALDDTSGLGLQGLTVLQAHSWDPASGTAACSATSVLPMLHQFDKACCPAIGVTPQRYHV